MEKVIMVKLNKEYKKQYALNNLKDFYEKVFEKEKINKKEYYDLYFYICNILSLYEIIFNLRLCFWNYR